MTVKELKEKLEQFPENCIVMIPNQESYLTLTFPYPIWYLPAPPAYSLVTINLFSTSATLFLFCR